MEKIKHSDTAKSGSAVYCTVIDPAESDKCYVYRIKFLQRVIHTVQ